MNPMRLQYCLIAAAVLGVVILTRIVWVMSYNTVLRLTIARRGFHPRRPMAAPTVQGGIVISWCGMRGIVTLAAAFALPEGFPHRDLILLTAFAVVLGSLVIQGLTLRPLISALHLQGRESGGDAKSAAPAPSPIARRSTRSTATRRKKPKSSGWSTARCCCAPKAIPMASCRPANCPPTRCAAAPSPPPGARSWRCAQSEDIGDDAFHMLEEELDWAELSAQG